jgi:hypothetical protein
MTSQRRFSHPSWESVAAAVEKSNERDEEARIALAKAYAARQVRREQLLAQATAIGRSTAKYAVFDRDGECPVIRIRRSFIRLSTARPRQEDESWPGSAEERLEADVATRPPLTKLIHRPGNALQAYLSMLYVAQVEVEPGARWRNERDNNGPGGWGELFGLLAPDTLNKELNLRVTRALTRLAEHDLVRVGKERTRNRFDRFTLFREDKRQVYLAPSETASRSLPTAFFTAGWHLVLDNREMATLLAVVDQTGRPRARRDAHEVGEALPESVRWRYYGLAPEAFAARHELEEFGLIENADPMERLHGKLSDKQREEGLRAPRITLKLDGFDFGRPAIDVVKDKLAATPMPPHRMDHARSVGLLDKHDLWRGPAPTGRTPRRG